MEQNSRLRLRIVFRWVSSNMYDQYFDIFTVKGKLLRIDASYIIAVYIPEHTANNNVFLEGQPVCNFHRSKITCMPNLITIFKVKKD